MTFDTGKSIQKNKCFVTNKRRLGKEALSKSRPLFTTPNITFCQPNGPINLRSVTFIYIVCLILKHQYCRCRVFRIL